MCRYYGSPSCIFFLFTVALGNTELTKMMIASLIILDPAAYIHSFESEKKKIDIGHVLLHCKYANYRLNCHHYACTYI